MVRPHSVGTMLVRKVPRAAQRISDTRSLLKRVALQPWILGFLVLCPLQHADGQDKPPDLSGLWLMDAESGAPNVRIFQDGNKIKSVFVDAAPKNKWGFVIGDPNLDATIEGHTIRGKLNEHYEVDPFKTNCPDIWAHWTDVELTVSADGTTLEGRWKRHHSDKQTCKLQSEEWLPLKYIRPPAPVITQEADRIRVSLSGDVLFDFDKYDLKPDAQSVLAQVLSGVIDKHPNSKLVIEGHTDNVGTTEHNQVLSVNRAQSVATWLEHHGVAASRISVIGWGKTRPRYPNDTDEHRHRNRRVEISVLTGKP
jgi:outer membrane protein OmpA-like peptidoglycan-associated protein